MLALSAIAGYVLDMLHEPIVETIQADVAGLYFRSVLLKDRDILIPQHVHPYDHATFVGSGSVRLFIDGVASGDFHAGTAIPIKAHQQHVFRSLEPMTRLCCVHHTESAIAAQQKE